MKNGLLIWNIVLTLVAGYLLISKFSTKRSKTAEVKTSTADTATRSGAFRIAYFQMDSVAANFEEVKQLKAELSKRDEDNNNELARLQKDFRDKYDYYQRQAEDGKMTDAQKLAASDEMKRMNDNIQSRKLALEQDYNNFMMSRQNDIKTKIEGFIKDYNKTHNYTYVLSDDPGLFYYRDSSYDITGDVIKGLNKLYPAKKSKTP